VNGSSTWTPSAMPDGDVTASSIVAYPGNPGGVNVVAAELFGGLGVSPTSTAAAPGRPPS
jgi:hypothetical protein